jgi:hypothetical protein
VLHDASAHRPRWQVGHRVFGRRRVAVGLRLGDVGDLLGRSLLLDLDLRGLRLERHVGVERHDLGRGVVRDLLRDVVADLHRLR